MLLGVADGVAMLRVARWLLWCCFVVARCCYGVARCCYGVARWLLWCCYGVAMWLLWCLLGGCYGGCYGVAMVFARCCHVARWLLWCCYGVAMVAMVVARWLLGVAMVLLGGC